MGAYKYLHELDKKKQSDVARYLHRIRTWEFRQLPAIHRATHPTRVDRARKLGYKAKQGYVIYRCRIRRGDRKKRVAKGIVYGKPKNQGVKKQKMYCSLQTIAERRVGRRICGSLRVLNSYWVGQDGVYKYFEIILVDPNHNAIRNDRKINWICHAKQKHRECRGITSAGRHSRGLTRKGNNASKLRPSRRAVWKRHQLVSLRRYR